MAAVVFGRARTGRARLQSVGRALDIIECFSAERRELGVSEIARALGLKKSTAFGIIATLAERGYLRQNSESGRYSLGLKLLELGTVVTDSMDLAQVSAPFLKGLVEKHRETAHLVVLSEGRVAYIHKVESPESIRMCSQVGRRLPVHCTGVGKALAAFLPPAEVREIIRQHGLPAYTGNTIVDEAAFFAELERVRAEGVAYDNEEIEEGLKCVAAPVFDHHGRVVAAISLAGPAYRVEAKKPQLVESVKETAREISRCLGN